MNTGTYTRTSNTKGLGRKALADLTGTRSSTIQFYSDIGLLPFHQAGEGLARRYDLREATERLRQIRELRESGLSVGDVVARLAN